ncbi:hypothetical protein GIB67_010966, partial [Kingdonia uniflora]
MVVALEKQYSIKKPDYFPSEGMFEITGRQAHSLIMERMNSGDEMDEKMQTRSYGSRVPSDRPLEKIQIGWALDRSSDKGPKSRLTKDSQIARTGGKDKSSDLEMMKERFAKLLLGEDMSGGGKGVSSALALSNAITNLAASVFGEQSRLEPMSVERKTRWRKEI